MAVSNEMYNNDNKKEKKNDTQFLTVGIVKEHIFTVLSDGLSVYNFICLAYARFFFGGGRDRFEKRVKFVIAERPNIVFLFYNMYIFRYLFLDSYDGLHAASLYNEILL